MKQGKLIKVSSIPWVIIVLAFVLLYAAYFLLYIPQQESLIEQRAFRILQEYAANMKGKLDYYETHFRIYSPYYSVDRMSKDRKSNTAKLLQTAISKNEQVRTLIANLDKTINTVIADSNSYTERIIYDNGQYIISFKGANPAQMDTVITKFVKDPSQIKIVENSWFKFDHHLPMMTFMENLKFDKLLGNIALLSDSSTLYNSNLKMIQDITNPGLLADTLKKLQGGFNAKINIRGENCHVMVLPFTFLGNRLYLAGFISAQDFRHKTRNINNQFLITLAGLLLLFLFGMPILKILFISRNEQLKASDGTASTISLIFGIGFFILIIMSVMKQFIIDRQNLRQRLTDISEILNNNISNDFETIKQLYEDIVNEHQEPVSHKALVRTVQNIFKEKYFVDQLFSNIRYESDNFGKIPDDYMKKEFPLNEVFLIGDDGILKKIVSRTGATSFVPVDLSHRNYFVNMKENSKNIWVCKTTSGKSQPYFIESIKSYNSGKKEAAFSFRLEKDVAERFGSNILAITSPMPSLYNQVLPEDVGFLIINKLGDVLFHSDQSKNLHENFLSECDENIRLKGAINHRVTDMVRLHYNEKDWLARIVPLKDAPLFHITLIDYKYKHDKNARILFYTFYFLIATFILILAGMGLIFLTRLLKKDSSSNKWFFNWLLYRPENHRSYFFLLITQTVLVVFQMAGLVCYDKPVTMFVYQTILIIFSAWAATLVLGTQNHQKADMRLTMWALPQSIFFLLIVIFAVVLFFFHQNNPVILPIFVLILTSLFYPIIFRYFLEKASDNNISENPKRTLIQRLECVGRKMKIFHLYVFLWLISISALPAIQYYLSVKMQEDSLWKRNLLEYVAGKNLELDDIFHREMRNKSWYKNIAGNGLDFLSISHESCAIGSGSASKSTAADWFYTLLPDPVTNGNHLVGLLKNESHHNEWTRGSELTDGLQPDDDVLCFSQAGREGQIRVEKMGSYQYSTGKWLLIMLVTAILVIVFLWYMFVYVAGIVLRTLTFEQKSLQEPIWEDLLKKEDPDNILLVSLNNSHYLNLTQQYLIRKNEKEDQHKIVVLPASRIEKLMETENSGDFYKAEIIWISGLEEILLDPLKFEKMQSWLTQIKAEKQEKLVVELTFGFDFINEHFEELLNENLSDKAATRLIRTTQHSLEGFFYNFYKYEGVIAEEETIPVNYSMEPRYRFYWNNLTSMEKLILTDLSEDGMLNYKNKQVINQLKSKGLITFKPYPQIYSTGFQHFLTEMVDPMETRVLQLHLGRQGNWHNIRYLILLILIPLLIFIFIAQGTSVEKVIAIATGGLAVLSGIMRIFESDVFRPTAKIN